jgi:hypothetical protein
MASAKKQTAFRIESEILDGLKEVRERDGVPISEQVRRALRSWLESKGVTKTSRKRAAAQPRR